MSRSINLFGLLFASFDRLCSFPFRVTMAKNFIHNVSSLSYIRGLPPYLPNGTTLIISDNVSYTSLGLASK